MVVAIAVAMAGCAADGSMGTMNRPYAEPGILIGAGAGALLGAAAYSSNRTRGALIGAIGGGIAGGAVGAYMDKQRQDLQKALAKEIQLKQARVDEMPNHALRVTMTEIGRASCRERV